MTQGNGRLRKKIRRGKKKEGKKMGQKKKR